MLQGITTLGGNILGGLGNVAAGIFGTNPSNPIGTQVQTAVGNVLNTTKTNPITQQIGQFIGNLLGTSTGGTSSGNLLGFSGLGGGGSSSGLLGGLLGGGSGGIGSLLAAGIPAYYLGKAAMEETENQRGVPLIPLTQETSAGRYNIEAEIRRRMGLPAPDPVEFGMLPRGTLPELSGGRATPAGSGVVYEMASQTVPNLERPTPAYGAARIPMERVRRYRNGGIVALAEGGSPMVEIEIETEDGESMDADEFERMNGGINGEGTETSDDVPAMLSDGEYVMTGRAVRGAGAYDLNVGDGGIITLTPGGEESRERGTDLMYQMMALFEEFAGAPEEDD
jgi:hypothetical protein